MGLLFLKVLFGTGLIMLLIYYRERSFLREISKLRAERAVFLEIIKSVDEKFHEQLIDLMTENDRI